jgi:hypothetical protein
MNRRSFFKFLGIGAATAAVAPTILAKSDASPQTTGWVTLPPRKTYQAIFPESVRISDKEWRYLEFLKNRQLEQLGLSDLQNLKKVKRNV